METHLHDAHGAVLLETVVAMAVLATVGSAAAWMASESMRVVTHVHQEEAQLRQAARLLTAVSLWPRDDLDRHLGDTKQGRWRMRIDRVAPAVYAVSLRDTATATIVLQTSLLREEAGP